MTYDNRLLMALPQEEIEASGASITPIHLRSGQILHEPGVTVERVYFPESCMITLQTPMTCGREVASTIRGRDGAVGYVEALGSGISLSRAVVQIAGGAHFLTAKDFRALYDRSPHLRSLSQRRIEILLADARQSVACQVAHSAPERLARTLLECVDRTGSTRLDLTHDLLGDLTGLGRTRISQSANAFRRRGLIESRRGEITILNVDGLRALACECYHVLRDARRAVLSASAALLGVYQTIEPFVQA